MGYGIVTIQDVAVPKVLEGYPPQPMPWSPAIYAIIYRTTTARSMKTIYMAPERLAACYLSSVADDKYDPLDKSSEVDTERRGERSSNVPLSLFTRHPTSSDDTTVDLHKIMYPSVSGHFRSLLRLTRMLPTKRVASAENPSRKLCVQVRPSCIG